MFMSSQATRGRVRKASISGRTPLAKSGRSGLRMIQRGSPRSMRNHRRAEDDERRRNRHEHKVLRHVHEQERLAEGIERRGDGDEERHDAAEKAVEPPRRKLRGPRAPDAQPAARVNERGERKRNGHGPRNVPVGEEIRERDRSASWTCTRVTRTRGMPCGDS